MEVNWIVSKLEAFVIFAAVKKMFNHLSRALYFMLELSYFLISNDAYVSKWFNLIQVEIRYSRIRKWFEILTHDKYRIWRNFSKRKKIIIRKKLLISIIRSYELQEV